MINTKEHLTKIEEIQRHIEKAEGRQKKQLIKCLHRLQKQMLQCYLLEHKDDNISYIRKIK